MNYRNLIAVNQAVRSGKPCIKGTRITVGDVLGMLASGMSSEQIIFDFPELTPEHILASIAYAADKENHTATLVA